MAWLQRITFQLSKPKAHSKSLIRLWSSLWSPLFLPTSVAWIVETRGLCQLCFRVQADGATSQSWPWIRSGVPTLLSTAMAASMRPKFMVMVSRRKSPPPGPRLGQRATSTPSSVLMEGVPSPVVMTLTSIPWATKAPASSPTCRANPPTTLGGYSQLSIITCMLPTPF